MSEDKDIRWKQRFSNFIKSLNILEDISLKAIESYDTVYILASIQAFEMSEDLCLKLLQDYMKYQGFNDFTGPVDIVRKAFKANLINDGQLFMDMIKKRNITSHSYNEEVAHELIEDIQHTFLPALIQCKQTFNNLNQQDD